jgi:predicted nucleotidyltransferase
MDAKIAKLQKAVQPLARRYDVKRMEVFGSYAEGKARPDSDVDFLVEFSVSVPSIFKVMGLREELERALEMSVDLVTLPLTNPDKIKIEKTVRII